MTTTKPEVRLPTQARFNDVTFVLESIDADGLRGSVTLKGEHRVGPIHELVGAPVLSAIELLDVVGGGWVPIRSARLKRPPAPLPECDPPRPSLTAGVAEASLFDLMGGVTLKLCVPCTTTSSSSRATISVEAVAWSAPQASRTPFDDAAVACVDGVKRRGASSRAFHVQRSDGMAGWIGDDSPRLSLPDLLAIDAFCCVSFERRPTAMLHLLRVRRGAAKRAEPVTLAAIREVAERVVPPMCVDDAVGTRKPAGWEMKRLDALVDAVVSRCSVGPAIASHRVLALCRLVMMLMVDRRLESHRNLVFASKAVARRQ